MTKYFIPDAPHNCGTIFSAGDKAADAASENAWLLLQRISGFVSGKQRLFVYDYKKLSIDSSLDEKDPGNEQRIGSC